MTSRGSAEKGKHVAVLRSVLSMEKYVTSENNTFLNNLLQES